jgi:uncharacterized protein YfkK (UPF0435 family)
MTQKCIMVVAVGLLLIYCHAFKNNITKEELENIQNEIQELADIFGCIHPRKNYEPTKVQDVEKCKDFNKELQEECLQFLTSIYYGLNVMIPNNENIQKIPEDAENKLEIINTGIKNIQKNYRDEISNENLSRLINITAQIEKITHKITDKNKKNTDDDNKYSKVLHCGICMMIFGVTCLLIFHFFLSEPISDPTNQPKNNDVITPDSSFSQNIHVSKDKLQIIRIESKYLSSSQSSSTSKSKLSTKLYEKDMENTSTFSEYAHDIV